MDGLLLQIFMAINVFLLGIVFALAIRSIRAHYHEKKHAKKSQLPEYLQQEIHIPPEVKERMVNEAGAQFNSVLNYFVDELQSELHTTTSELSWQLQNSGKSIVEDEMKQYRKQIESLHKLTEQSINQTAVDIAKHQDELRVRLAEHEIKTKSRLTKEMNAEKLRLARQIDTKLADAVTSFLLDALQHDVDLGAQSKYLTELLEEHKTDLLRELGSEATVVK